MHYLDFIEASNARQDVAGLYAEFRAAISGYGYDSCVFGATRLDHRFRARYAPIDNIPVIFADYPEDWARHYQARGYVAIDPVVSLAPQSWHPLVWDRIGDEHPVSAKQARIMDEGREAGLANGLSVPIHGPGETFVISVASAFRGKLDVPRIAPAVRALCAQFFCAFTDLAIGQAEVVTLSPRERECLLWSARGESAWEIGVILNLSINTVNCYLKSAFAKLGTTNKVLAIVKAIRMGLISP